MTTFANSGGDLFFFSESIALYQYHSRKLSFLYYSKRGPRTEDENSRTEDDNSSSDNLEISTKVEISSLYGFKSLS